MTSLGYIAPKADSRAPGSCQIFPSPLGKDSHPGSLPVSQTSCPRPCPRPHGFYFLSAHKIIQTDFIVPWDPEDTPPTSYYKACLPVVSLCFWVWTPVWPCVVWNVLLPGAITGIANECNAANIICAVLGVACLAFLYYLAQESLPHQRGE